jgi:branched-chain amino acid transport system permease protein
MINGIAVGSIYALLVTGFNLMVLVAGVVQFAYPHVVVLSMYVAWYVLRATGNNLALGILAAIGSGVGISLATEPIFRSLTRRGAMIASLIASLGVSIVFTDIMSHGLHFGLPVAFPESLTGRAPIFQLGMATLFGGQLATFIGSLAAVAGFLYLLYRTQAGRAFRAMAQNPFVARLLGIPIIRTSITSYATAGLLGGLSAVFLAMALCYARPALGDNLALKVIAVTLFAGLGNLRGGLIAGLIIGLVESIVLGYIPGDWSTAVIFGVIMISIMVRPQGVFARLAQLSGNKI